MKRLLVALLLTGGQVVGATTVIVPDQSASIQAAVDRGADTVLVRPGTYPEVLDLLDGVVLRRLVLPGSDARPEVGGLRFERNIPPEVGRPVSVEGFAFRGPVTASGTYYARSVELIACRLDSGFATVPMLSATVRLSRCTLAGSSRVFADYALLDSNSIQGPVRFEGDIHLTVRANFASGTDSAGIVAISAGGFEVIGNRFIEPNRGIVIYASTGDVRIVNNTVRNCSRVAISAYAGNHVMAFGNEVADCLAGFSLTSDELVTASRNRISRTTLHGMVVSGSTWTRADSNVVDRCGGSGMLVAGTYFSQARGNIVGRCGGNGLTVDAYSVLADHNTSYLNAGHGIVAGSAGTVAWNVGYRNGGAGLWGGHPIESACNNWFENVGGPIVGRPPLASDLQLDPMFCDLENDDVGLHRASPLLRSEQCGPIGALGPGCGTVPPTELLSFSAQAQPAGVELRWRITHASPDFVDWLERAEQADGPWTRVAAERTTDGADQVELDRDVRPGRSYRYRFASSEGGVISVLGAPIEVATATQPRFGLVRVGPNPMRGPILVEFAVVEPAEIALEVFDLQGRRLTTLARGRWPAGHHHVQWSGIHPGGAAAAGVYTLRYRYPGGVEDRRVVRLR